MIGAVVLAAGLSTRMGQPKHIMPWGATVMVRRVVDVLAEGGVDKVVVVTGHARAEVEAAVAGSAARTVFNPDFTNGSMLTSLQVGLKALAAPTSEGVLATLVALGDQPQIEATVVRTVIQQWRLNRAEIVAPSFEGRRGHPILFARSFWPIILSASFELSPRELLQAYAQQAVYLPVPTDSVVRDIDTPDDYRRETATLPTSPLPDGHSCDTLKPMAEGSKKRILVVDDDPEITTMLEVLLDLYGYEVRIAHGAAQGMAALTTDPPDVMLLDVMMPHVSGLELCRYVRREPRLAHMPVIVFSARANDEYVRQAMEVGATLFVKKTASREELLGAVDRVLGLAR